MNDSQKAYTLALEAASIDFGGALQGLLAGHKASMDRARAELAESDMALLMALSLTEKGKRLDKEGVMASKIISRISNINMCETEKRFVNENTK
jgi:hypothetical protein